MSMFNDIEWKKNDKNCISNVEQVKNYSNKFYQDMGFSGFRFGKEVFDGQWDLPPTNSHFQSYQCFESRITETKKTQKYHSLQWRVHEHRSIISNNSCYESSQYLRYCYELMKQICLEEERKIIPTPVVNRIKTNVEPDEVEMMIDIFSEPSTG